MGQSYEISEFFPGDILQARLHHLSKVIPTIDEISEPKGGFMFLNVLLNYTIFFAALLSSLSLSTLSHVPHVPNLLKKTLSFLLPM